MRPPVPTGPDSAVLLLNADGGVLAWSGPPELVGLGGNRDESGVSLSSLYQDLEGVDLGAAVAETARASSRRFVRSLLVRRRAGARRPPVRLSLHKVGERLVAVVVSATGEDPDPRADPDVALIQGAWAGLKDAMILATVGDDPEGPKILAVNNAFSSLFGMSAADVEGRPLLPLLGSRGGSALRERIRAHVARGGDSISDLLVLKRSVAGQALVEWQLAPVRDSRGGVLSLIVVLRDVSLTSARNPVRKTPDVDPLTGLPNQVHFMKRLERSVERAAQAGAYTFAVLAIDVQGLGALQRRLGTVVSNSVLDALVWRVRRCLRPGDLIARLGDQRLAVLLDHFGPWGQVDDVLERIHLVTESPYTVGGERITLAVVDAAGPIFGRDRYPARAQEIIEELGRAVTRARKRTGRPTGSARTTRNDSHSPFDLSRAAESGDLRLDYLPLMSVETGKVVALEALLRWTRPDGRALSAGEFVADAESRGFMVPVGRWVLRRACEDLEVLRRALAPAHPLPIHVNLSASEFWSHDLVSDVERQTATGGVDPSWIRLEVPEEAVSRSISSALPVLKGLADVGFETWIDRFGEGGIPLRDLPNLPVKRAKVSPSLAWKGGRDAEVADLAPLLRGLLSVGRDLGWQVSVSGVESEGQRSALARAGCDMAQGFLFSEPRDPPGIVALVRQLGLAGEGGHGP